MRLFRGCRSRSVSVGGTSFFLRITWGLLCGRGWFTKRTGMNSASNFQSVCCTLLHWLHNTDLLQWLGATTCHDSQGLTVNSAVIWSLFSRAGVQNAWRWFLVKRFICEPVRFWNTFVASQKTILAVGQIISNVFLLLLLAFCRDLIVLCGGMCRIPMHMATVSMDEPMIGVENCFCKKPALKICFCIPSLTRAKAMHAT